MEQLGFQVFYGHKKKGKWRNEKPSGNRTILSIVIEDPLFCRCDLFNANIHENDSSRCTNLLSHRMFHANSRPRLCRIPYLLSYSFDLGSLEYHSEISKNESSCKPARNLFGEKKEFMVGKVLIMKREIRDERIVCGGLFCFVFSPY